jgi:hypothetical protein
VVTAVTCAPNHARNLDAGDRRDADAEANLEDSQADPSGQNEICGAEKDDHQLSPRQFHPCEDAPREHERYP